jgi:Flp pilus assembly protein protease CpaA
VLGSTIAIGIAWAQDLLPAVLASTNKKALTTFIVVRSLIIGMVIVVGVECSDSKNKKIERLEF